MANEVRLIDANALLKRLRISFLYHKVKPYIDKAPTVDAVEVVRCKDCKYASCNPVKLTYGCQHPSGLRGFLHEGFYFCSYGERKDNGN